MSDVCAVWLVAACTLIRLCRSMCPIADAECAMQL